MTNDRRRSRRITADWAARFRFAKNADWRPCRLIDVSWDGAALDLTDVDGDEPLTGRMYVEIVSLAGTEPGITVDGTIRHGARTAMGRTLVGLEFRRLTKDELKLLRIIVNQRVAV